MDVNSHIQLPKFILNYFRCPNGHVSYLSLNDLQLHSCAPKKLGTQKGYYSEEMEQYLNKQIENPFSRLVAEVIASLEQGKASLVLPFDIDTICKRYITAAAYRSGKAYTDYLKESQTASLCDDQTNHDELLFFSTRMNNGVFPGLETARMLVLVNQTERQFVVPRNCFYLVSSNGMPCIIVPITPKHAFGLVPKGFSAEADANLWLIEDADYVWHMNKQALSMEYVFNHEFVASASKRELMELNAYAKESKDRLESLRSLVAQ